MTERAFQNLVIDLARICGWKCAHFRPALTRSGKWRTAVQGDGAGWPDLALVHRKRRLTLFRELKTDRGKVTAEQQEWLNDLAAAGQDAGVWRPKDWDRIERLLKGE